MHARDVPDEGSWPACALTFDDGPDPLWTPRVLARLGHEGARATFFVMAERAAAHPSLVDRMRAEGHEVALHCVRHVRHTDLDERALRSDTREGLRLLERLGVQARHWRAPWGVTTPASRAVAANLGLALVHWDLDTHDWRGDSAEAMHARVAGEIPRRLGGADARWARTGSEADRRSRDAPARPGAARDNSLEAASCRARRGPAAVSAMPVTPAPRGCRRSRPDRTGDTSRSGHLERALSWIAANADDLDRHPRFPAETFRRLGAAGALGAPDDVRSPFLEQLRLVRAVSRADGSVGRILDGHLSAVERLLRSAPGVLDAAERSAIVAGRLLLGVWGADPERGEGEPATMREESDAIRLYGVKTFCSGAGGVQRALVVVRDAAGERRLAYVNLARGVWIDRDWYRADGLRASESHRVVFSGARVLALLGGDGEMLREPFFSRDAIRTSATWAGIADGVVAAATSWLRRHGADGQLTGLAAGRMRVAVATIDRWLDYAGWRAGEDLPLAGTSIEARWAIASACREIMADAATACGSRPLAAGGALSRGRRDLDLFLLQHRLEPKLAAHGTAAIGGTDRE